MHGDAQRLVVVAQGTVRRGDDRAREPWLGCQPSQQLEQVQLRSPVAEPVPEGHEPYVVFAVGIRGPAAALGRPREPLHPLGEDACPLDVLRRDPARSVDAHLDGCQREAGAVEGDDRHVEADPRNVVGQRREVDPVLEPADRHLGIGERLEQHGTGQPEAGPADRAPVEHHLHPCDGMGSAQGPTGELDRRAADVGQMVREVDAAADQPRRLAPAYPMRRRPPAAPGMAQPAGIDDLPGDALHLERLLLDPGGRHERGAQAGNGLRRGADPLQHCG